MALWITRARTAAAHAGRGGDSIQDDLTGAYRGGNMLTDLFFWYAPVLKFVLVCLVFLCTQEGGATRAYRGGSPLLGLSIDLPIFPSPLFVCLVVRFLSFAKRFLWTRGMGLSAQGSCPSGVLVSAADPEADGPIGSGQSFTEKLATARFGFFT